MTLEEAAGKIRKFFYQHRRIPSYQEMCFLFGFASKKASFSLAQKLIAAGILEKDETGRLLPRKLFPSLPVLGTIKAGRPADAEQQLLETMSLEGYLVSHPERSYLLKVSGDSMIGAGIQPGDLVVIEKGKEAKDSDIVVASVDGEFTLKYFKKTGSKVYLSAANKNYPVIYPQENLTIFGTVVSVIRKYH